MKKTMYVCTAEYCNSYGEIRTYAITSRKGGDGLRLVYVQRNDIYGTSVNDNSILHDNLKDVFERLYLFPPEVSNYYLVYDKVIGSEKVHMVDIDIKEI